MLKDYSRKKKRKVNVPKAREPISGKLVNVKDLKHPELVNEVNEMCGKGPKTDSEIYKRLRSRKK